VADETTTDTDNAWHALTSVTIPAGNNGVKWVILSRGIMQSQGDAQSKMRIDIDGGTLYFTADGKLAGDTEKVPFVFPLLYTVPDGNAHTVEIEYFADLEDAEQVTAIREIGLLAFNSDQLTSFVGGNYDSTSDANTSDSFSNHSVSTSPNFPSVTDYLILGHISARNATAAAGIKIQMTEDGTAVQSFEHDPDTAAFESTTFMDVYSPSSSGSKAVNLEFTHQDSGASSASADDGSLVILKLPCPDCE